MATGGPCAYCGENFGSIGAYDRHLRVTRKTVTTPRGYVVENEQVVTCRSVAEYAEPMKKTGKPRLVPVERKSGRAWVIETRDPSTIPG